MLILNAAEVKQALPMAETIEAMKTAYAALSAGQATVPLRTRLDIPAQDGLGLFMPAFVNREHNQALAIKLVTLFNNNPTKNLPLIHATVIVMDPKTGQTSAILEGGSLTAIRTGAGCGAAADIIARKNASTLAIFGAGVQSRTQLEAMCTVRQIETVWVYARNRANIESFVTEMRGQGSIPLDVRIAESPQHAVADADIIATATTSASPVFDFADIKPDAHVSGAGSYTPAMQEVPTELIVNALVTVDSRSATLAEAGDLIVPIETGAITADHIHAEIGEIINGSKIGRKKEQQITYFKSVGVAVQDALAGQLALKNAQQLKLGTEVEF